MDGKDSIIIRVWADGVGERPCVREDFSGGETSCHCFLQGNIFSFLRVAAENPNLDPRGKLSWEVFASAYTAAIAPRILLT